MDTDQVTVDSKLTEEGKRMHGNGGSRLRQDLELFDRVGSLNYKKSS